jgi:putative methionine-R-sulfoxide reductase with GAF domain
MDTELRTRIAGAVAVSGPRSERAQAVADLIREATAARWVGIYTVDDATVSNDAWSGPGPPAFPSFPVTSGLTAHAVRTRALALSNDVANDPRYLSNQDDSGSELILPVVHEERVVGTLDLESDQIGAFDGERIASYERLARSLTPLWIPTTRRSGF